MKFLLSIILGMLTITAFSQDKIYLLNGSVIPAVVTEINQDEVVYRPYSNRTEGPYILDKSKVKSIVYENGIVEEFYEDERVVSNDMIITTAGELYEGEILSVSGEKYTILIQLDSGKVVYNFPFNEVALVSYASSGKGFEKPESFLAINEYNSDRFYLLGFRDAETYYNPKTTFWTMAGVTFLYLPAGIIAGLIAGNKPPSDKYINHPQPEMLEIPAYREAFYKKATSIKKKNILTGGLTGFGISAGVSLVLMGIVVMAW